MDMSSDSKRYCSQKRKITKGRNNTRRRMVAAVEGKKKKKLSNEGPKELYEAL